MARLVNPFSGAYPGGVRGERGANDTGNWRVPPAFSGGYPASANPQVRGANDTGNWENETTGVAATTGAPINVLTAEDGITFLLAEDGATFLTQEM